MAERKSVVQSKTVELATLQAHPRNYNRHPAAQLRKLKTSLRKFGQVRSIVVWRDIIIAGHGLVDAARSAGMTSLRADVLPDDYPEHLALAYVAADNELARQGDPDMAQLLAIVEESKATDAELLEAIGFDEDDYQRLLREVGGGAMGGDTEPQIDRAEELRVKWGVESGQLWQLGDHRLICGDCTDAAVVARVMGGERAALAITSPPYNQQLQSQSKPTGMHSENKWFHRLESAYADSMPEDEYQAWQVELLESVFDVVQDGGSFFYNHKHRYRGRRPLIPLDWIRKSRWELRQEIIWDRRGGVAANAGMFIPGDERVYWLEKDGEHVWNGVGNNRTTVWSIQPQANNGAHVCPYPLELMEPPIVCVSSVGGIVYDPFLGSGTTLIACENLSRRCRAVEISPGYVAVALERWATHTGKTPELVSP